MIKISKNEISRKVIHILSSVMPLSYLWFIEDKSLMVYILVGMSSLALVIEYLRNSWTLFSRLFNALFYYMLREHELKGKLTGATWLLIGWSITVMLFNIPIAVGVLVVSEIIGIIFLALSPVGFFAITKVGYPSSVISKSSHFVSDTKVSTASTTPKFRKFRCSLHKWEYKNNKRRHGWR